METDSTQGMINDLTLGFAPKSFGSMHRPDIENANVSMKK